MAPTGEGPRDDLVRACAPFLPQGAVVHQAFVAQSAPHPAYFLLTYLTGWAGRTTYLCVAVTDTEVVVLDGSRRSGGARPRAVRRVLPRATRLGPVTGRWSPIDLPGVPTAWVHRRFAGQVAAADRALDALT